MRGLARHFVLYGGGKVWSDGATTMHRGLGLTIALLGLPGCFTDPGAGTSATSEGSSGTASSGEVSGTASTSSSGSSGEPVPTGSDTGTSTVEPTSTGGPMDGDVCDPWMPLCPDGSKCAAYASDDESTWDANKCVPAGTGMPGMGCIAEGSATSGQDTCAVGGMCWDVDENLTGVCFALCGGTQKQPSCPPGSSCFSTNEGVVNLCVAKCDPLIVDQCDGVCVLDPVGLQFICLLDASGTTQVGDACEFINECPPSSVCEDPARSSDCEAVADGCCLAYCDLRGMDPCPADYACEPILGEEMVAPLGHENVGVCVLP